MLPDNNYQTVWNVLDALIAHYGLDFAIARVVLDRDDWANTTCVVNLLNRRNGRKEFSIQTQEKRHGFLSRYRVCGGDRNGRLAGSEQPGG